MLLLFLADRMTQDRRVSVPRSTLATALRVSERRITERIKEAHEHGFLSTVRRGQKGITAVYQGLFPDAQGADSRPLKAGFSESESSPLNGTQISPLNSPKQAFSGTPVGPTNTRADLSERGSDRDVSNEENEACRWHGFAACPEDCADHPSTRRESA